MSNPIKIEFCARDRLADFECASNLAAGEVHVYYGLLADESPDLSKLRQSLTTDEIDRATRFHFDKDRNHYIATRGSLRTILASYLNVPAREIKFRYSEHGKPSLDYLSSDLSFNVSHTAGLVALAFTRNRQIGVDVEAVRTNFKAAEIAERFFSEAEKKMLREKPASLIHESFFRCWTLKEAYIKARGEGLSHPLSQFDVDLNSSADESYNALVETRPNPKEAARWLLRSFRTYPGFAAAVAVESE